MRRRGSVQLESVGLIVAVALAGSGAVGALGGAFGAGIQGDAGGRAVSGAHASTIPTFDVHATHDVAGEVARGTSSIAVSAQAALFEDFGALVRHLSGAAPSAERPAVESAAALRAALRDAPEYGRRSIRVGMSDYPHELPQAMRYSDRSGGGIYYFPSEAYTQGIDGFFVPWKHTPEGDIRNSIPFDRTLADESFAVSLKDFSGKNRRNVQNKLFHIYGELWENGQKALASNASRPEGVPPVRGTDVFVNLPQFFHDEIVQDWSTRAFWRHLILPDAARGVPAPFRRVIFETHEGIVVLTRSDRELGGLPIIRGLNGEVNPTWVRHIPSAMLQ
ncbi:MAG: hypothetical protein R3A78_12950 [Polyangiales bacterium]|nr:hypothetical protein [Myxococcales bacterium]